MTSLLRDVLVRSPDMYTFRTKPESHVTGAKPEAFCRWVFDWLGAGPEDTLDDIFPGLGAVARAWSAFSTQERICVA